MQLILALAAHFKPTSIGGKKHSYSEKSHRSPASVSKQRFVIFFYSGLVFLLKFWNPAEAIIIITIDTSP